MSDRFNPTPLVRAAWGSLRRRAVVGREGRDWLALATLTIAPVALGVTSWLLGWSIRSADALIGGFALLAGVLLASVPQLASWRQRLTERNRTVDGVAKRKLDEATANTLVGVLVSVGLAVLCVIVGNTSVGGPNGEEDVLVPIIGRSITAIVVAGSTYLVLTLALVVNLVFDAYEDANELNDEKRRKLDKWHDNGAA